ncbi:SAM-dependent methyltransferase [Clostridium saccharoperbutylacetonicum]|uniref:Methyltransferase type 11 n=1 Tax=Clostridium saccharoperbutylacetonicum N1-4(HMT) TaxID=931276 RepID=M1LVT6_9CLOT|nr:class I SAM-dependent methyltransferase [Clostridium saccharoperbutylacetonicum]AGF57260.1 methyltransferase type 11 [Clostridium saccharoperbutylacetonicum N1-4(HMT)]NRT61978.1 SAM-dependent methyltransferase [Clostridium saccharoperbutylacetonicum]NSB25307.1 SAM-dependent methyltransferase [Clostridium saccharoperbutylacetonicum]NSB44676.1 SAM-dependent methyltransferase [Clostridium saccharoperbutylacetonicum]
MDDKINSEIIKTEDDVFLMLDEFLEKRDNEWWNKFYSNKEKAVPFFKNIPDENLITYFDRGILKEGKALDIGCGKGRNSIYIAKKGLEVCGVDFSETSIEMANKIATEQGIKVKFSCQSIFDFQSEKENYDFIYDSGCFHHIKPHRREQYLSTILKYLKPNGYFAMICFNLKGGANISDYDVYKDNSMHGGIGFSDYKLKIILESYFEIVEFREMIESDNEEVFGKSSLWSVLMRKKN